MELIQTYLKTGFEEKEKRYAITFTYPGNFIWQKPVETSVVLIGGLDNYTKFQFQAAAYYYLDRKTGLMAKGTIDMTVLNKPYFLEASVEGKFDENFHPMS